MGLLTEIRPQRELFQANSNGVALVLVLWVIVMLTVMAASFSLNMRREINLVGYARASATAGSVAEAGIYYAMLRLLETDIQKKWRSDGSVYEFYFAGARVRVRVFDEAGKFNLNYLSETLAHHLLQSLGTEVEEAGIADAILDWVDSDEFKRPSGAEADEYLAAGLDYGPRNQPFRSIQELQLVLGVSGDLYRKLEPMVTVYTLSSGMDPTTASEKVLRILPGVTEEIIDIYLEERTNNALNNLPPPQFPVQIPDVEFTSADGNTFDVYSEALFPDGRRAAISTVIRKTTNSDKPFKFLEWKRIFPGKDSLFGESVVVVGQAGVDQS